MCRPLATDPWFLPYTSLTMEAGGTWDQSLMTDHYLLDSISASMHAIDCVKRVLLIKAPSFKQQAMLDNGSGIV